MQSISKVSDVIFHSTSIKQLAAILTDNVFKLSTSLGTEADNDHQKGKLFYFSTARTRLGVYHKESAFSGSVLLRLNGTLFNSRYSGKAIDYWGEDFRKARKGAYEEEDRIYSNTPYIGNARSYIQQIDILLNEFGDKKGSVRTILRECLKYKIPVYFYKTKVDWLTGNKAKSYKISIKDLSLEHKKEVPYEWLERSRTKKEWGRGFRRRNDLWDIQQLVYLNDYNKLDDSAKTRISRIVYDTFNEQRTVFKNEVHNNKSNANFTEKLIGLMRYTKTKSADNFYDVLKDKWSKILNSSRSAEDESDHWKALEETGFYGRKGAGALIYCTTTKRYLLAHRSRLVEQPGTWGIIGGAINGDEKPLIAVRREMKEELGVTVHGEPKLIYIFRSGSFSYFNFLVTVEKEFTPKINWETSEFGWFKRSEFPSPLHFGVEKLIDEGAI